jgi:hypothetical protein
VVIFTESLPNRNTLFNGVNQFTSIFSKSSSDLGGTCCNTPAPDVFSICTFQNWRREGRICVLQVQQIMQRVREGLLKNHTTHNQDCMAKCTVLSTELHVYMYVITASLKLLNFNLKPVKAELPTTKFGTDIQACLSFGHAFSELLSLAQSFTRTFKCNL